MTTIKCCDEENCQTLTSGEFCKAHTLPELSAETQAQIADDVRLEQIMAGELKSREWEQRANKIDSMRAQLDELRGSPRSNIHEQPVFSKKYEENCHG